MILSIGLALVLGSYITISYNALVLSNRSFYANATSNLVDTGLDQAMAIINNNISSWTGGSISGSTAADNIWTGAGFTKSSGGYKWNQTFTLSSGVSGTVYVWVNPSVSVTTNANSVTANEAQVAAEAIVTLPNTTRYSGGTIVKEAEIFVPLPTSSAVPTHLFTRGLVAKGTINLSGQGAVDGWTSNYATSYTAYNPATVDTTGTANAKVGSADTTVAVTESGQAAVYGQVALGGTGTISSTSDPYLSTSGQAIIGPYGSSGVNSAYVSGSFTTNFPTVVTPTSSSSTPFNTQYASSGISYSDDHTPMTLPNAGDTYVLNSDGSKTYYYSVNSISLSGKAGLNVTAGSNVVFVVTGDVSVTGQGVAIPAKTSSSLPANITMYVGGNVSLSGQGNLNGSDGTHDNPDANMNPAAYLQIYGTGTTGSQTYNVSGQGNVSATIYAPNANINLSGQGDFLGAAVGNNVTISGQGGFHYDLSLSGVSSTANSGSASTNVIPNEYRELYSATDRAAFASYLP
ncbi:MAG TPA: hypothetical protein VNV15_07860 [Opitutaceae bacterium]|nr:hypothetical protein [Opitutaceae bacterium]